MLFFTDCGRCGREMQVMTYKGHRFLHCAHCRSLRPFSWLRQVCLILLVGALSVVSILLFWIWAVGVLIGLKGGT